MMSRNVSCQLAADLRGDIATVAAGFVFKMLPLS
jgi:hypothetical protein